jgi:ammonia channel protein AmtB
MSSGYSALVGAWYLGPGRDGTRKTRTKGNGTECTLEVKFRYLVGGFFKNLRGVFGCAVPLVVLGTGMLWFGWFGFNAGSALAANGLACHAFATTNTGAASSMFTWMFMDLLKGRR